MTIQDLKQQQLDKKKSTTPCENEKGHDKQSDNINKEPSENDKQVFFNFVNIVIIFFPFLLYYYHVIYLSLLFVALM